ncbi:S-adenosyl-L-methionine-dependent methyltransferase [Elaphomyces granulatus]
MAEVAATLVVQLSSLEFDDKVSIYSLMLSRNTQLMASFQAQDTDSAYGDELSAYSTSLTSSVLSYQFENGRRYHAFRNGIYLFPNDEMEADRLDLMHEMALVIMNRKLFIAPLGDSPQRVLDLGTGTGIWAMDFGDWFPSSEVIGVDLSPIQPSLVPPNVKFLVDDIEEPWLYNAPFDFVHGRSLACSVKDYKKVIRQSYELSSRTLTRKETAQQNLSRNVAPGGWVEFQDWDMQLYSEDGTTSQTSLEKYYDVVFSAFARAGYSTSPGPQLERWLREAGFEDVHAQRYKVPLGVWPKNKYFKTIGSWNLFQAETGFEAAAMAILSRNEGWPKGDILDLVDETRIDARSSSIHPFFYL